MSLLQWRFQRTLHHLHWKQWHMFDIFIEPVKTASPTNSKPQNESVTKPTTSKTNIEFITMVFPANATHSEPVTKDLTLHYISYSEPTTKGIRCWYVKVGQKLGRKTQKKGVGDQRQLCTSELSDTCWDGCKNKTCICWDTMLQTDRLDSPIAQRSSFLKDSTDRSRLLFKISQEHFLCI